MSQVHKVHLKDSEIFQSENRLDQGIIIHCILEFLSERERNTLAGLNLHSQAHEIKNEFYNQPLIRELNFGKCLMVYCWHDKFWKDSKSLNKKIERVNILLRKLGISPIDLGDSCSLRAKFITNIWERIGEENWKLIEMRRSERKLYISSLSQTLSRIAKLNTNCKNTETEELIRKRIDQHCFIEESSLSNYIKEPLEFDNQNNRKQHYKWVSVGSKVGKTTLLMIVSSIARGIEHHDFSYVPVVLDGYASSIQLGTKSKRGFVDCSVGFWDTVSDEEYDKLRCLSYPETSVFTLNYAINDWTSLERLAEYFIWECMAVSPNATFVVVSTKNDLEEECYWKSMFYPATIEEPISTLDGIEFTKAIGGFSFIETSSRTGKGTNNLDRTLVLMRLANLKYLKNIEKGKKCLLM